MSGRIVKLDDPDREDILAELRGEKKLNRLGSVAEATVVDDHLFPSKKEANRYAELVLLQRNGNIFGLHLQGTLPLVVNDVKIFKLGYRFDFSYVELQQDQWQSWKFVIEDSKGMLTETFIIKEKLVLALYGIKIRRT